MRVNFVTRGGPHLASYRLRIALPAEELEKLGVGVVVGKFDASCDAHIFSKHWDQKGDREASRLSPCPIFDVCDDWFGREHDAYYREMSRWCRVVASSRRLAERVMEETGREAACIPEPYELPEGVIREPHNFTAPMVLWFGHCSNLPSVAPYHDIPNLFLCTNAVGKGVIPYSPENLRRCLDACDVVIIPQDKDWKSANRMVESIRAGRFVVANDIPAGTGDSGSGQATYAEDWHG